MLGGAQRGTQKQGLKLGGVLLLMVGVLILRSWWEHLLLSLVVIGLILAWRASWERVWRGVMLVLPLVAMGLAFQLAFAPRGGLYLGGLAATRLLLLGMLSGLLGAIASPWELAEHLRRLLWPLRRVGLPVGELALVMGLALQLVPLLQREAQLILRAQRARGLALEGPPWRRARRLVAILLPLILSSLRRAEELALALRARSVCYVLFNPAFQYARDRGRTSAKGR